MLQGAIQYFSDLERKVERALVSQSGMPDVAKLNSLLSAQSDRLDIVYAALREKFRH